MRRKEESIIRICESVYGHGNEHVAHLGELPFGSLPYRVLEGHL